MEGPGAPRNSSSRSIGYSGDGLSTSSARPGVPCARTDAAILMSGVPAVLHGLACAALPARAPPRPPDPTPRTLPPSTRFLVSLPLSVSRLCAFWSASVGLRAARAARGAVQRRPGACSRGRGQAPGRRHAPNGARTYGGPAASAEAASALFPGARSGTRTAGAAEAVAAEAAVRLSVLNLPARPPRSKQRGVPRKSSLQVRPEDFTRIRSIVPGWVDAEKTPGGEMPGVCVERVGSRSQLGGGGGREAAWPRPRSGRAGGARASRAAAAPRPARPLLRAGPG